MREVEQMHGGKPPEGSAPEVSGSLVVLSDKLGPIARAQTWLRAEIDGQLLIAVPKLRVEHIPAMMISGGMGLGALFSNIKLRTNDWEDTAGFVGGAWTMWRLGTSELHGVGFVRGQPTFNVETAVKGITSMLK